MPPRIAAKHAFTLAKRATPGDSLELVVIICIFGTLGLVILVFAGFGFCCLASRMWAIWERRQQRHERSWWRRPTGTGTTAFPPATLSYPMDDRPPSSIDQRPRSQRRSDTPSNPFIVEPELLSPPSATDASISRQTSSSGHSSHSRRHPTSRRHSTSGGSSTRTPRSTSRRPSTSRSSPRHSSSSHHGPSSEQPRAFDPTPDSASHVTMPPAPPPATYHPGVPYLDVPMENFASWPTDSQRGPIGLPYPV